MKVLVARPQGQQQGVLQRLAEAGHVGVHVPALAIEPIPLSAAMRRQLMDLDLYYGVFFVSRNAARLALSAMADLWPQWPVGVHWLAVGRATAAELRRWHLQPQLPAQGFNSEAVLALPCLQQLEERRLLICRGDGGRDWLAEQLQQRGAEVDTLSFYRRQRLPVTVPDDIDAVLVSSGDVWLALAASVPARCRVVAAGERVAALVREQHRGPLTVAASAHDEDMVAALQADTGGR